MNKPTIMDVVDQGYCVGCGGCAFATGGKMGIDAHGFYRPTLPEDHDQTCAESSCPFLVPELNEDALADRFLPQTAHRNHKIGKHTQVFAAHVAEADFRRRGSSGGIGSWLPAELLRLGKIDGVIHARRVERKEGLDPFFRYGISRNEEEIRKAAHSHYHVVELSEVLKEVAATPGRYMFVGIPCMVKAMRRAQLQSPELRERIAYSMALICGHLKSIHWAVSLGWGVGIAPEDLEAIEFRVKSEGIPAKAYYFGARKKGDVDYSVHDSADIVGGKFNLGAMMPDACNYCDDVVGETADLTIGDAWLPRFAFDWRGKNMVVSRSFELDEVISNAAGEGRIVIDDMTAAEAADAQAGGFRQRREGLAYRLAKAKHERSWTPTKRDLPDMTQPGPLRARIYDLRMRIATESREAFRRALDIGDFGIYVSRMQKQLVALRRLELTISAFRIVQVRLRALLSRRGS